MRSRGPSVALLGPSCVVALAALLAVWHAWWWHRYDAGYVPEWDEAGYMAIGLRDTAQLRDDGLPGLWSAFSAQPFQAPLVPLLAVPLHLVLGSTISASEALMPLLAAALLGSTWLLARRFLPTPWALLTAVVTTTLPVAVDFSRVFHFATAAAVCLTLATWALLRSDGLRVRRWAVLAGVLLGLMTLSRSMTLSYLPGLGAAAVLVALRVPGHRRERLAGVALLVGATAVTAAVWYLPSVRIVGYYLLRSGYGEDAAFYGEREGALSLGRWTKEARVLLDEVYLPAAVVLALGLGIGGVLLARALRSSGPARVLRSDVLVPVAVVAEGYLVLCSSPNQGTAFALPWLPCLVLLVVTAVHRLPARARLGGAVVLLSLSGLHVASKSGLGGAPEVVLQAGRLGAATVLDPSDPQLRQYRLAGLDLESAVDERGPLLRQLLPFAGRQVDLMLQTADDAGRRPLLAVAVDDVLLNSSRYTLAAELGRGRQLQANYLQRVSGTRAERVARYVEVLRETEANLLLTGPGIGVLGAPGDRTPDVEQAARATGFRLVGRTRTPDGRPLTTWWRDRQPSTLGVTDRAERRR